MPLIVENGTIVAGADTFATVEQAKTFATSRGLNLAGTDEQIEGWLRNAADYLNSLEERFKGYRVAPDVQTLCWPREGVFLYSSAEEFPEDEIPNLVIQAQCRLTFDAKNSPNGLLPVGIGREVLREKVDVIEREYSKTGSGSVLPEYNAALAILAPLLKSSAFSISTVRV